ncbi:enoyl-CoA hydratase/isomerase family protein [Rhodococcus sp. ACPA1]|uniref:enoyl-CoA hydratase/isomerase family protein n=1 Tax=Rhodococcus sp. ACPA1 TaxID=2028572 RepID=UPI000BB12435|nr:enoyl-CoA hydratase/isomerase family protein [Rhodococcus sp. ACPA1]PBC51529.1 enoyl-CoA hydratase [Rhodococcus sp. ACPA1]
MTENGAGPAVLIERSGAVGRLVLNRPSKSNALTFDDAQLLKHCLRELEEDDDIKVIILKGRGKSFCSGHDFDDVVQSYGLDRKDQNGRPHRMSVRERLIIDRRLAEEYLAFQYSQKPVIAQVQGAAVGFGMYLTELVDLVICADDARFSHAEQRLGFAGNTWHLNMQILTYGPKKVREMLLLGSQFNGQDAVRMGLANASVPLDELDATTEQWAERVARNPKDALVTGKAIHNMAIDSLGGTQQFYRGAVGHTLGTLLHFEPDEFNFFRERRDSGTKAAYQNRDATFEDTTPR